MALTADKVPTRARRCLDSVRGAPGRLASRAGGSPAGRLRDRLATWLLACLALCACLLLGSVGLTVAWESWPVVTEIGLAPFLLGTTWMPVDFGTGTSFGILNFVLATMAVSALGLALSFCVAAGCALFLSCGARPSVRTTLTSLIDLLAGVPSVVFGFVGLVVIVKAFITLGHPSGQCVLAAAAVLAVMLLPYTTSALAETMDAVGAQCLRASATLGVGRWHAAYAIVLPCALRRMGPSLMMAFGRAMGETMAVMMVVGNANLAPRLLGKAETIASLITLEMGTAQAGSLHMSALFGAGFTLMAIVFVVDALALAVERRAARRTAASDSLWLWGRAGAGLVRAWAAVAAALAAGCVLFLFGYVFVQGAPVMSWDFVTQAPAGTVLGTEGGIAPAIWGSLWFVGTALVIAAPLALACALVTVFWLDGTRAGRAVGHLMAVAAGAPSIVCGLFAYAAIVRGMGLGRSVLAGGAALAIMILPFIEVRAEKALRDVPRDLLQSGLALGCSRVHVLRTLVVPACTGEVVSAVALGGLYALGATAPLVFCGGVAFAPAPAGVLQPAMALPLHLYLMLAQGTTVPQVYATAFVLMALVLVCNLAVSGFAAGRRRRWLRR